MKIYVRTDYDDGGYSQIIDPVPGDTVKIELTPVEKFISMAGRLFGLNLHHKQTERVVVKVSTVEKLEN